METGWRNDAEWAFELQAECICEVMQLVGYAVSARYSGSNLSHNFVNDWR